MSIQKKSLISTLKTAKKANVAGANSHEVDAKGAKVASMRMVSNKQAVVSTRRITPKAAAISAKSLKSLKSSYLKSVK